MYPAQEVHQHVIHNRWLFDLWAVSGLLDDDGTAAGDLLGRTTDGVHLGEAVRVLDHPGGHEDDREHE